MLFSRKTPWRTCASHHLSDDIADYVKTWYGVDLILERQYFYADFICCAFSLDDCSIRNMGRAKRSQAIIRKWVAPHARVDVEDHEYDVIYWIPTREANDKYGWNV